MCGPLTTCLAPSSFNDDAQAAAAGNFPVWGTCQGFQQLAQYSLGADEPDVLSPFDERVILLTEHLRVLLERYANTYARVRARAHGCARVRGR